LNQIGQEINGNAADIAHHRSAAVLDHPDGSVTTEKLADGAVTATKVAADVATQAELDAHTNATSGVHGATSAAMPSTIVQRDSAGRFKAAAPAVAEDVARKAEVDAILSAVNTHAARTDNPHNTTAAQVGAVSKSGDMMNGKLTVVHGDGKGTGGGQISVKPAGGAPGQRGIYSLYSTFENHSDNTPRRTADIVAGFNGGTWGREFLAFHVGKGGSANDNQDITNEIARLSNSGFEIGSTTSSVSRQFRVKRMINSNAVEADFFIQSWSGPTAGIRRIVNGEEQGILRIHGPEDVRIDDRKIWHDGNVPVDRTRKITISQSAPSGGADGDIWIQY